MASDLSARWETAKRDFEGMTGKKKPDPKGKIAKLFNHTGVSGALKKCDKYLDAIDAEVRDMTKKAKLIAAGRKYIPTVAKATKSYMKELEKAVLDEIADKGEKTTYSKALKFLKSRLDSIELSYEQKIDAGEIALDETTSGTQKAAKMVHKSLRACVMNAVAGIQKVKADPTPARYNEIFNQSDNVMRKIQVQLVMADNAQKKGLLPNGMKVDPRFVADKFTPWQAGGKPDTKADNDWNQAKILEQLKTASGLVKLSNVFLEDLVQHTR